MSHYVVPNIEAQMMPKDSYTSSMQLSILINFLNIPGTSFCAVHHCSVGELGPGEGAEAERTDANYGNV